MGWKMDFTGKGKTTEGKGLTGYPLAKRFSLAIPSMLLPSKPLPPIRQGSPSTKPSKVCSGKQENVENGSGCEDETRKKQELISEGKGHEAKIQQQKQREGLRTCSHGMGDLKQLLIEDQMKAEDVSASHRGLTGYPLAKRFSLHTSHVPLHTNPLPTIQKRSHSSELRKKLQPLRTVIGE
ncbi:hypothetical protein DUI87_22421 [Hirundo rustica rustica]|uniref:Uncharacterized protein n=1 Tax=Hirundo rustica rustica TaxID=333673 RepID=A0A3M0JHV4_HIRRU|nr:hypothetical protein DUI87_22421 [Hirundo rustica rustica]